MDLFVKFSCGCIGINPDITGPDPIPILVKPCDSTSDYLEDLCLHAREDLLGKTFEYLADTEQVQLIIKIEQLMHKGYRAIDMARALRGVLDNA